MSSSDTDCIKKLEPLLNSYEKLLDNYSKIYKQHLQEYTTISNSYDVILDTKNTPKHESVRRAFNNLQKKKKK